MKIVFAILAFLISMSASALVDADDCASILEEIHFSPHIKQQPLEGSVTRCANNQVSIAYGLFNDQVQLNINISDLRVKDQYQFFGLASYYSTVRTMLLATSERSTPSDGWVGIIGRFKAKLLNAQGAALQVSATAINFSWPPNTLVTLDVISGNKAKLSAIDPIFDAMRYSHLWGWLASLAKGVEWSLVNIQRYIVSSWGWSVVVFAVLIKVLLLPVAIMTIRLQREVSRYQAVLTPQLNEIKANYDGAQAHERIMAAHKALGISPFYTLRPILASLIQIPILIAVFNALGEMHQFNGASFLWIKNLAYPDAVAGLPFAVPMLGDKLSLLPVIMALVTILSTILFQNRFATAGEVRRQKLGLYCMAAAFFILFYPFPAVMVLYWTLINMLHIIQQRVIKL